MWPRDLVDERGRQQHGLITRGQLTEVGVSREGIDHAVRRGRLVPLRPGVYRLPGAPPTRDQALMAAVLGARHDVVLSHVTAAHLWGLKGFVEPNAIDLLSVAWRCRLPGVRGHTTVSLRDQERTILRGMPITTPERSVIDACDAISLGRLSRAVDEALRSGLIRYSRLKSTFEKIPASGRRRRMPIERVLDELGDDYDPGGSAAERDVMRVLERVGIRPLPQQQFRVRANGHTYYLDYAWPDTMTALEFDGRGFHTRYSDFHRDQQRTRDLQAAGWTRWPVTIRTTDEEIIAIARRATHPSG